MNDDLLSSRLHLNADCDELGLTSKGIVYLDYGGAAPTPKSVLKECFDELLLSPLCNPHTRGSKLGDLTHSKIEFIRREVLSFIGDNAGEYMIVFTGGCTSALKLIADIFPWSDESTFAYSSNSHNSLMGIRELSPKWMAISAMSLFGDELFNPQLLQENLCSGTYTNKNAKYSSSKKPDEKQFSILGIPGECNFTGTKANWENVYNCLDTLNGMSSGHEWMWILDGAKLYADGHFPISEIPSKYRPDFITLSFYKIFGYPTGIGALLIRRNRLSTMRKQYFGGGTLRAGAADAPFLIPKSYETPDYFEDGTLNYHGIISLGPGLRFISSLGGLSNIEQYCGKKRNFILNCMKKMVHSLTGRALCTIYSFSSLSSSFEYEDIENENYCFRRQGPTIAFNLCYADGTPIPFGEVGRLANSANIQLRTGCFCNLGGCQEILNISAEDMEIYYYRGRQCSEDRDRAADVLQDRHTGACRISLGFGTTQRDCEAFLSFLRETFLDRLPPAADEEKGDNLYKHYHHRLLQSTDKDSTEDKPGSSVPHVDDAELFWTQKVQCYFPDSLCNDISPVSFSPENVSPQQQLLAIYVYPVKSCAGVRVDNWPLLPLNQEGLLYDRIFAIVDESGRVLSQKMFPVLALIRPYFYFQNEGKLDSDHLHSNLANKVSLRLTSPFNDTDLDIPLESPFFPDSVISSPDISTNEDAEILRVCGRKMATRRISVDADEWITTFFHNSMSLQPQKQKDVKMSKYHIVRSMEDGVSKPKAKAPSATNVSSASFANTAQFLMLSMESVRSLIQLIAMEDNAKTDDDAQDDEVRRSHKVKVENFRPNIVVSSTCPHEEDQWKTLTVPVYTFPSLDHPSPNQHQEHTFSTSTLELQVTGPCARCTMVDVNSRNGRSECRVFEALDAYRKQRGQGVCFGQFLASNSSKSHQITVLKVGSFFQPKCKDA